MRTLILFGYLLTRHFWSIAAYACLISAIGVGGLYLIPLGFEYHFQPPTLEYSCVGLICVAVVVIIGRFILLPEFPRIRLLWRSAYVWARLQEPRRSIVIKANEALERTSAVMSAHNYLSVKHPEKYCDKQEFRLSNSLSPDMMVIIQAVAPLKKKYGEIVGIYAIGVSKLELMNEAGEICKLLNLRVDGWEPILVKTLT